MEKNKKIENLRALAICLVVLGHSIIIYSSNWNVYSTEQSMPLFENIKLFINIIQMPLFFSLSGFLFYYTIQKKSFFEIFINKFKRLIIPFISIAILWLFPIRYIINYNSYQNRSIVEIFIDIFTGVDCGHLWYLASLFFIFIICFVVVKGTNLIFKNKKLNSSMLFFIFFMFSYFSYLIPEQCGLIFLRNAVYNSIYFILGFIINENHWFKNNSQFSKIILLFPSLLLLFVYFLGKFNYIRILSISIIFSLYSVFPSKENYLFKNLSYYSFGLYLFHSPLVYITFNYFPNISPWMMLLINFGLFGSLSMIITHFVKKTKFRFVLGE